MRIVQAVWGVFHHFDLARELERRGHLDRVYSTFPWARLKREGLPHSKVQTFPWFHMAQFAARRSFPNWHWASDQLGYANTILFDEWLDRRLPNAGIDALIALSGAGLNTGKRLQNQGAIFVCDRGSTHQRVQEALLNEEFRRWGSSLSISDSLNALYAREVEMYEIADAITVPSAFAARTYVDSGIAKEKIHVIPYGVQLDNFKRIIDPPRDRFEVLFVGQIGLRKGIPYLLQAFSALRHPQKRLRLIGSVEPHIRQILQRFPQEQVEFLGKQPQAEVARTMSSSHLLVLPSIEDGFGLVLGQAMACGCPVLASMNTGAPDLIREGVEGFIVPIRDPNMLAIRMQQLADEPQLQQRMSEAALARVRSLGGWTRYGDQWVTMLEALLATKESGIRH